jgi:hypothetical protein
MAQPFESADYIQISFSLYSTTPRGVLAEIGHSPIRNPATRGSQLGQVVGINGRSIVDDEMLVAADLQGSGIIQQAHQANAR